jgi:outer membrane protein OmpA-like peptidoglycan-associated protein
VRRWFGLLVKAGKLAVLRRCEPTLGGQERATLDQRKLVRAIESASRGRLAHAGRQYKLVAGVDLAKVPNRDDYEVVPRDAAAEILTGMIRQNQANAELVTPLGKAQGQLTRDWRPPLLPDGLVLLRRSIVYASHAQDAGLALTPSQLKTIGKKTDWIEIEVVDEDDQPYTGNYRLELTDGKSLEGNLAGGLYANYDIDAGSCKLLLFEKGVYSPASLSAATPALARQASGEAEGPVPTPPPSVVEDVQVAELSAKVVDELGKPLAGIDLLFQYGGDSQPATTGADGVAQCEVPGSDSAQVVFADAAAVATRMQSIWAACRVVERKDWVQANASTTTVTPLGGKVVKVIADPASTGTTRPKANVEEFIGATTTVAAPATLSVQPLVIVVRMLGKHFDVDKCFLLPTALSQIQDLVRLHKAYDLTDLLIVGHTDTSAAVDYNLDLSLERTSAMRAYLTNDVGAWLAWYGSDKKESKRWGGTEDLAMISTLLAGTAYPPSILGFQRWHNAEAPQLGDYAALKDDGVIGPLTRKQLILDYMHREDTTVPPATGIKVHGCGEYFPLDATGETLDSKAADGLYQQEDRRVEVYLFPRELGMLPPVPGDRAKKSEPEYPEWRRRSVECDLVAVQATDDFLARWIGWAPAGGTTQPNLLVSDLAGAALLSVTPTEYAVPNFDGVCQRYDLAGAPTAPSFRISTVSDSHPMLPPVVFDMAKLVAAFLEPQRLGEAVTVERFEPPKKKA